MERPQFSYLLLALTIVVFHIGNSPLLGMVYEKPEIARLDASVISAINYLTILYNSYTVALSVLVWFVFRLCLRKGQKWAFFALLITIGFVEIFAFVASAPLRNLRWQVNVPLSALYIVGIGLSGYSLFKGDKKRIQSKRLQGSQGSCISLWMYSLYSAGCMWIQNFIYPTMQWPQSVIFWHLSGYSGLVS